VPRFQTDASGVKSD